MRGGTPSPAWRKSWRTCGVSSSRSIPFTTDTVRVAVGERDAGVPGFLAETPPTGWAEIDGVPVEDLEDWMV